MILLTFNIINPDRAFKNRGRLSDETLLEITVQNTKIILQSLERKEIWATFFIEISLVFSLGKLMKQIMNEGHEICFYNIDTTFDQLEEAKKWTEEFLGKQIRGIRMKHGDFTLNEIKNLRFTYVALNEDKELNFPFKRFERKAPFTEQDGLTILHESISRYSQLPYSDFIFQILPLSFYKYMIVETIKKDAFVLVYLNSWQFSAFDKKSFDLPLYKKIISSKKLHYKLDEFLKWMSENNIATSKMKDFAF